MNRVGRNDPCPCGSGKKYKQCCALREQGAAAGMPGPKQVAHALGTALGMHQQGRYAEAEAIYRQVLAVAPGHADALHFCGVLAHQTGRHAEGIELIGKSLRLQPGDAMAHNNLGDALRALGRGEEALASFRQALALQPDFHEVHNNIGETLRGMGRFDEAARSFETALAGKPGYAEACNNLGLTRRAQGRLQEALDCLQQAVTLRPQYARAHYNLGALHQAMGRDDLALGAYEQALQGKPDYPEALLALAGMFLQQGQLHRALACCQRALQLQPGEDGGWRLYAEIIKLISTDALPALQPELLLAAFRKDSIDPQKLERIAVALICGDTRTQPLLDMAAAPDAHHRIAQALANGEWQTFIFNPLLLSVLEETVVTDYRLERLLAALRHVLLTQALAGEAASPALQRFAASLALQCFANDYIYALEEGEQQQADALAALIGAALTAGQQGLSFKLLVLACYQALYRTDFAAQIAAAGSQDAQLQAVLERQLSQPLQEEKIKQEIPRLTAIGDQVSQAVRQQYEENPYPRWRRRAGLGHGLPVHAALKLRFPQQDFAESTAAAPRILIAGCGTGSDAMQVAQSFADASIFAVDISLSSIAYARRATQAFGIDNIEFRQADILELAVLEERFDIIVSSGVLHHMRDPMAGWRVLTGLLKADGYMNIGLYSRRARHEVTAARQAIAAGGYGATLQDIRRFRVDVMNGRCAIDIGSLAQSPDFYSTSACRDLIFHVQEHLFSPLEIKACLDTLGLQFIGFEFANPEAMKRYLARFPGNPAGDVLENWETLEQEQPQIFAGMYQFWVRKKF